MCFDKLNVCTLHKVKTYLCYTNFRPMIKLYPLKSVPSKSLASTQASDFFTECHSEYLNNGILKQYKLYKKWDSCPSIFAAVEQGLSKNEVKIRFTIYV